MVVGGLWLLAKQKIYLDHETKEPVQVELPGGVRLKANSPALALFLVGFIPLLYPVYKLDLREYPHVETVNLTGDLDPQEQMIVVYASTGQDSVQPSERTFKIPAHFLADVESEYKVLLLADKNVISEGRAALRDRDSNGNIAVKLTPLVFPKPYKTGEIGPVSAEFAQKK